MKITVEKKVLEEALQEYIQADRRSGDQVDHLLEFIPEYHQEEVRADIRTNVVSSFMSFCQEEGINIPEELFIKYFEA